MGANQTSQNGEDRTRPGAINRNAASQQAVERALEAQRVLYEQRIKDLEKEKSASSKLSIHIVKEATPTQDLERVLEEQRMMYEQRIQKLVREHPATNLFGSGQLATTSANLYPDLNNERARERDHLRRTTAAATERAISPSVFNNNGGQGDFNSNIQTKQAASIYSPSAPPAEILLTKDVERALEQQRLQHKQEIQQLFRERSASSTLGSAQQAATSARCPPSAPSAVRSSSNSRSRAEDTFPKCTTCKIRFGDKIFQCSFGHSSCQNCKLRLMRCGALNCGHQLSDVRNFDLERYVAELNIQDKQHKVNGPNAEDGCKLFDRNEKVKCPNAEDGCKRFIKKDHLEEHMKQCPFKELQCPLLESCRWQGKLSQLSTHFEAAHPAQRSDVDTEMCLLNICSNYDTMHLAKIGAYNFLVRVISSENERKVYITVQLIGTKVNASKWCFEIHVYNKSQPRRKFQHTEQCSSASESVHDIMRSGKCVVLPLHYAMTFINEGALNYKFYIKKEEGERGGNNQRGRAHGRGRGRRNDH